LFEVPDGSTAATLTNISLFISPKEKEGKKTTRKKKRAFDYATRRTRERREKNRTRDKMSGNTDVEKGNFAVKAGLAQVRDSHRKELERARARFFFWIFFSLPPSASSPLWCDVSFLRSLSRFLFGSKAKTWR